MFAEGLTTVNIDRQGRVSRTAESAINWQGRWPENGIRRCKVHASAIVWFHPDKLPVDLHFEFCERGRVENRRFRYIDGHSILARGTFLLFELEPKQLCEQRSIHGGEKPSSFVPADR